MESAATTTRHALRVSNMALLANLTMGAAKVAGGSIYRSQALSADGFDSAGDAIADLTTLVVLVASNNKELTRLFPSSASIEIIGTTSIGIMILLSGYTVGRDSIQSLLPGILESVEPAALEPPMLQAAWFAIGSIIVKRYIAAEMMKAAIQTKSSTMAAGAKHNRVDSYTSMLTLLAIMSSRFISATSSVDAICGLIVSALVMKSGFDAIRNGILKLG